MVTAQSRVKMEKCHQVLVSQKARGGFHWRTNCKAHSLLVTAQRDTVLYGKVAAVLRPISCEWWVEDLEQDNFRRNFTIDAINTINGKIQEALENCKIHFLWGRNTNNV